MEWDAEPTIEDEIKWNDELSPAQKELLLKQVKLNSFRMVFGGVLYLFLLASWGCCSKDGFVHW